MIRALGPAVVFAAIAASQLAPSRAWAADPVPAPEAPKPEEPEEKKYDGDASASGGAKVSEELRVSRQGLGLDPGALQYGGLTVPPRGPVSTAATLKPGQINFHGFIRVP